MLLSSQRHEFAHRTGGGTVGGFGAPGIPGLGGPGVAVGAPGIIGLDGPGAAVGALTVGAGVLGIAGVPLPSAGMGDPHDLQVLFVDGFALPQLGHITGSTALLGLKHIISPFVPTPGYAA
jgi:hypothetical protein